MPITKDNKYRYYNQRIPRCPLCDRDLSDDTWLFTDGRRSYRCTECNKTFTINVELEYRFSTDYDENIKEAANED